LYRITGSETIFLGLMKHRLTGLNPPGKTFLRLGTSCELCYNGIHDQEDNHEEISILSRTNSRWGYCFSLLWERFPIWMGLDNTNHKVGITNRRRIK
jgi:hypothetical protein